MKCSHCLKLVDTFRLAAFIHEARLLPLLRALYPKNIFAHGELKWSSFALPCEVDMHEHLFSLTE